ncbi:glycosyltransferase family 2 protein [Herminiimonas fonticola]|uniref:Glycosyltransferase involved in cell wall biosynthesis n=1 Tax=Herminiimonas fonticola TaxID=303380 RepID=A0A4R6G897_9BURK|nr:glycosyltransferase family 2 protein [Herminiimonas fonticola]RBA24016.1 Glycosyl transferase family 2 [Herminiimonas fonticola]TDN90015.1 glycosyltransferase involved in cell wall biosynthesis [Herminiimonas fonticola]
MLESPKLSICLATYNRGMFIGETLDSILSQLQPGVELVVVDGASPDNTSEVMAQYLQRYPQIRYYREQENSGIDKDYDKAVGYAKGEFCWLMTDDDLLHPSAINRVIVTLEDELDLVVVNAEVKNADFSKTLDATLIKLPADKKFDARNNEDFFEKTVQGLSFIGCVIIRRELWLSRNRTLYYGTLFIHVGVIFQDPVVVKSTVISEPLITIRYGNAMWTPRSFEIWMFKWPELIWSFNAYSEKTKALVYPREPWRKIRLLALYRALGGYGMTEYRKFLLGKVFGLLRLQCLFVAIVPAIAMNMLISLHCVLINRSAKSAMYSLLKSRHANLVTRFAANILDVGN